MSAAVEGAQISKNVEENSCYLFILALRVLFASPSDDIGKTRFTRLVLE